MRSGSQDQMKILEEDGGEDIVQEEGGVEGQVEKGGGKQEGRESPYWWAGFTYRRTQTTSVGSKATSSPSATANGSRQQRSRSRFVSTDSFLGSTLDSSDSKGGLGIDCDFRAGPNNFTLWPVGKIRDRSLIDLQSPTKHIIVEPDSIRAPRYLLSTMKDPPPDPKIFSRSNSSDIDFDYGAAMSQQAEDFSYFRLVVNVTWTI